MPDGMTVVQVTVFLAGTLVAAFVSAVAGFALGVVALSIWLYVLTPLQGAVLVVVYALIVQAYAVWKLRRSIDARRVAPFVAGSAIGIPAGSALLAWASPADLRNAVGVVLIAFSAYNLARPQLPQIRGPAPARDATVGVLNGVLGASTGLGGLLPAIWSGARGWTKDEQRAVFQPTAVASFLMITLWFGAGGKLTADIGWLFVAGLPALFIGNSLGWKLYGRIDDAAFRKIVMAVVLISGIALVVLVDRPGSA